MEHDLPPPENQNVADPETVVRKLLGRNWRSNPVSSMRATGSRALFRCPPPSARPHRCNVARQAKLLIKRQRGVGGMNKGTTIRYSTCPHDVGNC